jgi:hypothetical protein
MTEEVAATEAVAPEAVSEGQTEGQTAEVESEEGEQPEQPETEDKKKSAAAERREREKAYKQRLREERDAALQKVADAEARAARIRDAGKSSAPPTEKDFPDYVEYVAARAVWAQEQRLTERDAGFVTEEAEQARRQADMLAEQEKRVIEAHWRAQMQEAKGRYADFDAVVTNPNVPIPTGLAEIIMAADNAADVAYHVASQPKLAAELARLPPIEAARAIGRIEATVSLPKPRTQTTAPAPIAPVKAGAGARPDPSRMSYAEYVEARKTGRLR